MKNLMNRTALTATSAAFALALAFSLMIALGGPPTAAAQTETPTGTPTATATPTAIDYDSDNDGLIEIATRQQLDAMRHDPNGFGNSNNSAYTAAFPNAGFGMGCPVDLSLSSIPKCEGYELANHVTIPAPVSPIVSNWTPIDVWSATFNGNGYVISDMTTTGAGMFASIGASGTVRNVGLMNASVTTGADGHAGALAGINHGLIETSYATGDVSYVNTAAQPKRKPRVRVGGLVGRNRGAIIASWADVDVSINGSGARAGGFAGDNKGRIVSSYSHGDINVTGIIPSADGEIGYTTAGGFIAVNNDGGTIVSSYSMGSATGPRSNRIGSFVNGGYGGTSHHFPGSYWDTDESGHYNDNNGGGCAYPNAKTTAELRGT